MEKTFTDEDIVVDDEDDDDVDNNDVLIGCDRWIAAAESMVFGVCRSTNGCRWLPMMWDFISESVSIGNPILFRAAAASKLLIAGWVSSSLCKSQI